MDCGAPIFECMGSVVAGDFSLGMASLGAGGPPPRVRERCGHCVGRLVYPEDVREIEREKADVAGKGR
jgi:hypothetical protein